MPPSPNWEIHWSGGEIAEFNNHQKSLISRLIIIYLLLVSGHVVSDFDMETNRIIILVKSPALLTVKLKKIFALI